MGADVRHFQRNILGTREAVGPRQHLVSGARWPPAETQRLAFLTSTLWKVPWGLIDEMEVATGCASDISTSIRGYEPGEFSPGSNRAWILDCKLRCNEGSNATRDDTVSNEMTAAPQVRTRIDRATRAWQCHESRSSAPRLTSQTTSELWRMLMSHEYDKRQFGA